MEPVVPTVPRRGSYRDVVGLTDLDEGSGGDVRIEMDECPTCFASVEQHVAMAKHESWHAAQAGEAPK
jgi:hypothetical protein